MGNSNRSNVIVVGAGASKEFGLPVGAELKSIISEKLDIRYDDWGSRVVMGDRAIADTLRKISSEEISLNDYQRAGWIIRDNMDLAPSIDNYLDTHSGNEALVKVGKLAICSAILDAEKQSLLAGSQNDYGNFSLNFSHIKETWLGKLFTILVSGRNFEGFLEALKSIKFISFNYDRCIQNFFYQAAKSYFVLSEEVGNKVLDSLIIIHPYGSVGDLISASGGRTSFGRVLGSASLDQTARGIKTFTEGVEANVQEEIFNAFMEAEVAIFLGFAFHDINIKMLFGDKKFSVPRVIGTTLGISRNSSEVISKKLSEKLSSEFETNDYVMPVIDLVSCTCSDLIYEFERLISASE